MFGVYITRITILVDDVVCALHFESRQSALELLILLYCVVVGAELRGVGVGDIKLIEGVDLELSAHAPFVRVGLADS